MAFLLDKKIVVTVTLISFAFLLLVAVDTKAAAPSVSLIANPPTIERGLASALSWYAMNSNYCVASGGWSGFLAPTGSANVYPAVNTEYAISCSGPDGTATSRNTVYVTDPTKPSTSSTAAPSITYYSTPTLPPAPSSFVAACAATPSSATVGQTVTFGTASSGGARPVRYQWIGDVQGLGETQTKTFSSAGTKNVTVTATDSNNRTAIGSCRVEVSEAIVVSTPAPAYKRPTVVVASKPAEPDYEKICREKGFVKSEAEVAAGAKETVAGGQEVAATSASGLSGGRFLLLMLLSNLFFIAVTGFFSYRFAKRSMVKT